MLLLMLVILEKFSQIPCQFDDIVQGYRLYQYYTLCSVTCFTLLHTSSAGFTDTSKKMRPLPLLLLLAGARVEGRQESHLEERQLLNQNEIKQANCSQLLDTFSESSSNFTRCNDE